MKQYFTDSLSLKRIGLSGKKFSGKNTVASIIAFKTLQRDYPGCWGENAHTGWDYNFFLSRDHSWESLWKERAFGDKLKEAAQIITGHDDFKTQKGKATFLKLFNKTAGKFIQDFGEAMRQLDPEIWIKSCVRCIEADEMTLFTDVRHFNELKEIESNNGIVVRIQSDGSRNALDMARPNDHISETELDNHDFHLSFDNSGTIEDLFPKVDKFLDWVANPTYGEKIIF